MNTYNSINVSANGQSFTTEEGIALVDFLQQIQMDIERVVVEYNEEALTRDEAKAISLKEGDALELIRIVAGG